MRVIHIVPILIGVVTSPVACGGDDPTGPGSGSFTATVSGGVSASLSGNAVFGVGLSVGRDTGWSIWLLEGNFFSDYDFIRIDRSSSTAPGVGTFTITVSTGTGPDDFVVEYEHAVEEGNVIEITAYTSLSGSLTIDVGIHGDLGRGYFVDFYFRLIG